MIKSTERPRAPPSRQLREANERLVLSVIQAQADAETAARLLSEATRSADRDVLTGLPNRALFLDRFAQAATHARRHGTRLALLFLDLDRFKEVNDSHGHAVGDQVLRVIAKSLESAVREADTVSRHGGDEFLILLTEINDSAEALRVAGKLVDTVDVPRAITGLTVRLTASIGVSIYPEDGHDAATLIDHADIAMYRAKAIGSGIALRYRADDGDARDAGRGTPDGESETAPSPLASTALRNQHIQLRDANERLIIAALDAQELQVAIERAQPFRVLVDHMEEGAFTVDAQGTVLFSNQRFANMVGLPRTDVVGSLVSRYFVPGVEANAFSQFIARGPGAAASDEFVLLVAGGVQLPVHISLIDLQQPDGPATVVCAIVTDLRHGHRRSDEVATLGRSLSDAVNQRGRTEERLELALEAAGLGSWELDLESGGMWCTRRFDRIFGRPVPLAAATLADLVAQAVDEDRGLVDAAFEQAAATGAIDIEIRIRRTDDGAVRWVHVSAKAFHEFGRTVRFSGTVTDVTDRRALEDQLRQSQKMEAVGQLTGGLAHDFNNLLLVIGGSIDLLIRRLPPDERTGRLLDSARRGVLRGGKLIAQLLAFSRLQELRSAVHNVDDLVPVFVQLAEQAVGATIAIRVAGRSDPWRCVTDANQLEVAVLNLVINARDAMPDGGRLTIATGNRTVDDAAGALLLASAGDYVVISIEDSGTGMSSDVMARVFEPFFTTKALGQGTGLGLSQVYGFARQSGGFVSVDSEVGKGSKFSIHLPRTLREASPAPLLPPAAPRLEPANGAVLVVDDDVEVRLATSALLRDLGYVVFEAHTARAALALLDSGTQVDLVFTDVVMPGDMNGIALAIELAARQPAQPVMLTSGYTGLAGGGQSLPAGATMLQKPYTQEELRAAVAAAIALGRA